MIVRPYRHGDEDFFTALPEVVDLIDVRQACLYGPTGTIEVDGETICMMGYIPMWPGVAQCWSKISPRVAESPKNVIREMRALLGESILP